jgi:twitching motility protein PilI
MGTELRSLIGKPFELLQQLEQRARAVLAGQAGDPKADAEWVGIAFRVGAETFLLARDETREVMSVPSFLTRVPGARQWIRGLVNVRGQLLPLIDLRAFFGGSPTSLAKSTRILVLNSKEVPAGLLVDEVLGFRRFVAREFTAQPPPTILHCDHYLAGAFRRGGEVAPVFSLTQLLESHEFLTGAA